jgi:AcrR family transcriptional regulator
VPRPFRQHVDEEILDRAAALFAQHGFAQTSLKALADAAGLSKAGLLHHYPSKEALYNAAQQMGAAMARQTLAQLVQLPPGPARDRRALELLADIALDWPGLVALLFQPVTSPESGIAPLGSEELVVSEMFEVDPADPRPDRLIRVLGALSALAVLSLAANRVGDKTTWRSQIVATCFDALGHRRRDAPSTSDQEGA